MPAATTRAYKDVTLQQLRSFCEVARLGSLKAAAAFLKIAQPTVWKQVHALETQFSTELIESHSRGCRLTEAGRLLVELAAPSVASIGALKQRLRETMAANDTRLTVATTQYVLVEHLPESVKAFERTHPNVLLTLAEMGTAEVVTAVESGEADLGLTIDPWPQPRSPLLLFEPCYELDIVLVTPKGHPLARRRRIRPADLRGFPLVNSRANIRDPVLAGHLDRLGLFQAGPRRVETASVAATCRYVEMGFGIGLVAKFSSSGSHPNLYEYSMSRYFGKLPVYLVWGPKARSSEPAQQFAQTVRNLLRGTRLPLSTRYGNEDRYKG